jgi:hypothetical protein
MSMIRKRGSRFFEKIMLKQENEIMFRFSSNPNMV